MEQWIYPSIHVVWCVSSFHTTVRVDVTAQGVSSSCTTIPFFTQINRNFQSIIYCNYCANFILNFDWLENTFFLNKVFAIWNTAIEASFYVIQNISCVWSLSEYYANPLGIFARSFIIYSLRLLAFV